MLLDALVLQPTRASGGSSADLTVGGSRNANLRLRFASLNPATTKAELRALRCTLLPAAPAQSKAVK